MHINISSTWMINITVKSLENSNCFVFSLSSRASLENPFGSTTHHCSQNYNSLTISTYTSECSEGLTYIQCILTNASFFSFFFFFTTMAFVTEDANVSLQRKPTQHALIKVWLSLVTRVSDVNFLPLPPSKNDQK